jgi:hypothetical protein
MLDSILEANIFAAKPKDRNGNVGHFCENLKVVPSLPAAPLQVATQHAAPRPWQPTTQPSRQSEASASEALCVTVSVSVCLREREREKTREGQASVVSVWCVLWCGL